MASVRKPFQGVTNIIRFNWHFYVMAAGLVLLLLISSTYLNSQCKLYAKVLSILVIVPTAISLLVSFYAYDFSKLYSLNWLPDLTIVQSGTIININAGFDETSHLLALKYPDAHLLVYDFYDAEKHTEVSIERARKAYPPYPGTIAISTASLPLKDAVAQTVFVIFAAHEIRNDAERVLFFKEISRVVKPSGKIIITEHIRDWPNFLAYNIGFLHFHSKFTWHQTFQQANLEILNEIKITPFISTFILIKNGTAH